MEQGNIHAAHNNSDSSQHHAGMFVEHSRDMIAEFRNRFYVVLVLTIPILAISPMIQHWLRLQYSFSHSQYSLFVLSTAVFLYGGWPFLTGWFSEMKTKNLGMMTLIGFAITVAYGYSAATVFGLKGMDFFWELATLILVMLLGHWIEMKSIAGASTDLELLVQLMPSEAHLVHGAHTIEVKTDALKADDLILVKPGERIGADGVVEDGESYLNESMLTGESAPVQKNKGQKVIAGSVNGNGSLTIRVTHSGKDAYLFKVVELVRNAQQSKSNTQLLADKAARWLTIIALSAGVVTFIIWISLGYDLAFVIERMVTVMVICCPHALGLAVPLVVAKSTSLSAQHGLLIKNRTAFENVRKITSVVFDKTGTLTKGKFEVSRIVLTGKMLKSKDELLELAGAVETRSEHLIASGILAEVKKSNLSLPETDQFKAISGKGVEATVGQKHVKVVSPGYLKEMNISLPSDFSMAGNETVVFVLVEDQLAGFIALADLIRTESAEAIATLHENKIKTVLLTGDNKQVAESVSTQLQMDGFYAEVLPHEKLEKIKELQLQGEFVAMTGDGVNDAPALAQADIGIAIGSGSDIAAETAGIILVNSNPKDIVNLILFGKATYKKMIQNLAWATGYNVVTIPLAAGVLYNQGLLLSPAIGAVLMTVSTIVVAINAGLLKLR